MIYIVNYLSILLGILFLLTALDKLINWKSHLSSMVEYNILKASFNRIALFSFISVELLISLSLFIRGPSFYNIILMAVLLALYSVAILINLRRGNVNISCGCGSVLESSRLSAGLIVRNAILLMCCVFLLIYHDGILGVLPLFEWIKISLLALSTLLLYGVFHLIIKDVKILQNVLEKFTQEG